MRCRNQLNILVFYSGEDRLEKKSFQAMQKAGLYEDICRGVIRPSAEECARNSRARSTKMRWAIRAGKQNPMVVTLQKLCYSDDTESQSIEKAAYPL